MLGDIAAGKEQTFGTLAARALSWIGGKLHYGHPDFLNGIFVNTRGVSLFLGPMLDSVSPKFGSAIAFIAHVLALVGMVGFFDFLVCQIYFTLNLHRKVAYSRPTFFLSFFLFAVVP